MRTQWGQQLQIVMRIYNLVNQNALFGMGVRKHASITDMILNAFTFGYVFQYLDITTPGKKTAYGPDENEAIGA